MIRYFAQVAGLLWPHALLILMASWLGVRARTIAASIMSGAGAAVLATLVYWVIQNGIAPERQAPIAGQLVALFLAGAVPLVAASLAGQVAHRKGTRDISSLALGIAVGLLLLVSMPTLQLRLGCTLTSICP